MIKFVGGVRCEDGGRNFIQVANSFDLASESDGFAGFKFSGADVCLKFELSDGTGIGGRAIFLWYGADGETEFVAF